MKLLLTFSLLSRLLFANYVTCEIQGQLANQLFQTAAVIAYALDHGYEVRFPSLKTAINADLNLRYVFHRVDTSPFPEGVAFEPFYEPTPEAYFDLPHSPEKNIRFYGYFPFEKYFSHHSRYIRDLFSPIPDLVSQIHAKYGELLQQPTVAVHIRTFLPDSIDPNNGIGRTNWDYFLNAIACFPENYTILIFSDAPEWVADHFPVWMIPHFPEIRKKIHFIQGNPHYFDFYFMSLCTHQILSPKSTFSWWAAWLNPNPDKIVMRPDDNWLPDEAFPASWRKISID